MTDDLNEETSSVIKFRLQINLKITSGKEVKQFNQSQDKYFKNQKHKVKQFYHIWA